MVIRLPYKDRDTRLNYFQERKKKLHEQGKCIRCRSPLNGKNSWVCSECSKKIQEWKVKRKLEAKRIVGRGDLQCKYCGCKDNRILEINHINGGGCQETKGRSESFYFSILSGKRSIEDLELTCRVCNARHYCEMKFDLHWKIEYLPQDSKV